jgi:hypothetical protein
MRLDRRNCSLGESRDHAGFSPLPIAKSMLTERTLAKEAKTEAKPSRLQFRRLSLTRDRALLH